jgi:hypothetical protein
MAKADKKMAKTIKKVAKTSIKMTNVPRKMAKNPSKDKNPQKTITFLQEFHLITGKILIILYKEVD